MQYPLVESVTALAWATVGFVGLPLAQTMLLLALVTVWLAIVVYDIRHTIIPDTWSYAASGISFVYGMVHYGFSIETVMYLAISAAVTALPLLLLWWGSRGMALGFGDVKLALSIGTLLGPWFGVIAVLYGFVYGALWAVLVLLPLPRYHMLYTAITGSRLRHVRHRFTMKSEVPFGPFLVLSAVTIWILTALDVHSPLIDAVLLSSSFL
jgi:prepilin signal peptidase PulO-like enzyme (type II secretory pathway)